MVEAPRPGLNVRETGIWGSPTAGVYKFDNGGFLQPGVTTVLNKTGQPEPVFTQEQWNTLQQRGTQSFPDTLVLVDEEGYISAKMRVVAQGEINSALSSASRSRTRELIGSAI